ncbi:MAG: 50S ribosomal protein L30 [Candidatus Izimaplasma sp.]|nr:50S ribosomal protein L30 [Candidatus Izimaplasma bacterium]
MAELHITLVRSTTGAKPNHRKTVKALGLNKLQKTVVRQDTPTIRGMVRSIAHLVKVQEK